MTHNDTRAWMAMQVGLNPNSPLDWPFTMLDYLIYGHRYEGDYWLRCELAEMFTPPRHQRS